MGSRHPWEITLREFVEKVRRYYGIEVDSRALEKIHIFRRGDRVFLLPGLGNNILDSPEVRGYAVPP